MKIMMNGKLIDQNDAMISVFDRGYLFGEGLFETIRAYQGQIPFLDKHLNRMEWGATFINIPFLHPREIQDQLKEVLKANQLSDARVKLILSGVNKDTFRPSPPSDDMGINFVIIAEKFVPLEESEYEEGVELTLIRSALNDPPPSSNLKSISWLPKMVARRELMEKDCYDGILLNAQGHVTETTTANLFWIKNEVVMTAPVSLGLLPGITRQVVIDLAKAEGLKFKENVAIFEELSTADEIFITSSILEVMPVTSIDGQVIGKGRSGKISKILRERYQGRIREEIEDAQSN